MHRSSRAADPPGLGRGDAGLERSAALLANPLSLLPFLGWTLLFGPIPEGPRWRGWMLDYLQMRYNALVSSLIPGVVWGAWHLPLLFLLETYQTAQMGSFLSLVVATVVYSVLMIWLYNNNRRSTLFGHPVPFHDERHGRVLRLPDGHQKLCSDNGTRC